MKPSADKLDVTAPTTPGTYYYGVCVDSVPNESNTANNCSAAVRITVQQPTLSSSTTSPLTETMLDAGAVTLTLVDAAYEQDLSKIRSAVTVSGIAGVTVGMVRRRSDMQVMVDLDFDGTDFDTDATLTFTVGAGAIVNYTGDALVAQVPVTAIKAIEFDLSVSAGTNLIHVPLKVAEVDRAAKNIDTIADLYDALGGANAVNYLITYDPSTQEWLSYFSPRRPRHHCRPRIDR